MYKCWLKVALNALLCKKSTHADAVACMYLLEMRGHRSDFAFFPFCNLITSIASMIMKCGHPSVFNLL